MALIEDELPTLMSMGMNKAQTHSDRIKSEAHWILEAKFNRTDMKTDKLREAWVRDQTQVADLMLAEDLASTLYWDTREKLTALRGNLSALQSMLRAAEDHEVSITPPAQPARSRN